jgi:hypothetical protein
MDRWNPSLYADVSAVDRLFINWVQTYVQMTSEKELNLVVDVLAKFGQLSRLHFHGSEVRGVLGLSRC